MHPNIQLLSKGDMQNTLQKIYGISTFNYNFANSAYHINVPFENESSSSISYFKNINILITILRDNIYTFIT